MKGICHAGCGVITAVTLRNPENAKLVVDAGGADLIMQIIKTHSKEPAILVSDLKFHHARFHFSTTNVHFWSVDPGLKIGAHHFRGLTNYSIRGDFTCMGLS